ncbi:hypothetical protein AgCh_038493 [Apium graveolens]
MQDCSTASTPIATATKLDKDTGKSVDITNYRGMIGSLLYLTASRPDIMYATCLCARFQADPREPHLLAVKRIFMYLKGTTDLGLWYPRESDFKLIGNPVQHSMTKHISIRWLAGVFLTQGITVPSIHSIRPNMKTVVHCATVLSAIYQLCATCGLEVCKAIRMALDQCQLSMGMSGDFEQAVSYIPYRGVLFTNLHPEFQ